MLLKEDAAARLGMAVHEIVSVEEVDGGHVVTTHDGQPTLITDDGELAFGAGAIAGRLSPVDAETEGPAVDLDGDGVPDGSEKQILAWVDEDPDAQLDRAGKALAAERAKDKPRAGLTAALERLVTAE